MNTYELTHRAKCPNGDLMDFYKITIRSSATIMVEDILKALQESPAKIYQEDLATLLRSQLGAEITIEGSHHGIKITSFRA
jgi:hypothetical protein